PVPGRHLTGGEELEVFVPTHDAKGHQRRRADFAKPESAGPAELIVELDQSRVQLLGQKTDLAKVDLDFLDASVLQKFDKPIDLLGAIGRDFGRRSRAALWWRLELSNLREFVEPDPRFDPCGRSSHDITPTDAPCQVVHERQESDPRSFGWGA